jgi:hypothetical protein
MVSVAIRALELEYLVKILDWSRSRYIFTDSDSTALIVKIKYKLYKQMHCYLLVRRRQL